MWPPKYLFLWNFDRYSVEIPKVILGFSIMTSSKKVQPNDCVSDRQPEMVMATQIGNTLIISGNMIASKEQSGAYLEGGRTGAPPPINSVQA